MLPIAIPLNDDTVTPGLLGFGVFLALLAALVFLVRSMNKQMKKIQAPREAEIKQREWERAQSAKAARATDGAGSGQDGAAGDPAAGDVKAEAGRDRPAK